jgi:hypothetical protein
MRIETAHRILIGTGIAFFMVYALFEVARWRGGGGGIALGRAAGGLAAAAGFAVYLRSYVRSLKRIGRTR